MLCAYRNKYGYKHFLIKTVDSLKNALDDNEFAGTILIDRSKAFHCTSVPNGLLNANMIPYCISNNVFKFMCSYLRDRLQRLGMSELQIEIYHML